MNNTIDTYGDEQTAAMIIERSVSEYYDDTQQVIGNHAFNGCTSLTTASFPVAKSIEDYAFYSCSRLTTVSFPAVTNIGSSAFANCRSLTTASFPVVTSIERNAFYTCSSLTTVSFPATKIIGSYAFFSCSRLTTVSFPAATSIGNSAFASCSRLTTASFPAATSIGSNAFYNCNKLNGVYLTGTSVPTLTNANALSYTAIQSSIYTGSWGSIFVRASMLSAFQSATNWATYSARMVGLTDEEIAALDNE